MQFLQKEIKAIAGFASTDESRSVLCGIYFEVPQEGNPVMVATDGRILAAIEGKRNGFDVGGTHAILPTLDPNGVGLVSALASLNVPITVCINGTAMKFNTATASCRVSGIERNYPEWRQVLPTITGTPTTPFPVINGHYFNKLAVATQLLGGESFIVRWQDSLSALDISINQVPNFYVAFMPMRAGDGDRPSNFEFMQRIKIKS